MKTLSEETIAAIAQHAHEANRAYCQSIGDFTQKPWVEAPQWQCDSAIVGVKMHIANPKASAEDSHESWTAHKVADGWVYGAEKDEAAKTHPCLVPYGELPEAQRIKDTVYSCLVKAAIYIEERK